VAVLAYVPKIFQLSQKVHLSGEEKREKKEEEKRKKRGKYKEV
jgi:hypothetical protein